MCFTSICWCNCILFLFSITFAESIWILTRKKRPSRRIIRKALRALRALDLSASKLVKVDQVIRNGYSILDSLKNTFEKIA